MPKIRSFDIDDYEDIEIIKKIFKMNKIIWSGRSHNFNNNELRYLTNVIKKADPLTNGRELRIFEESLRKYLKVKMFLQLHQPRQH